MKKVLVTGAGGYIGRHVVQKLLEKGVTVIAVDFNTDGIPAGAITLQQDIFSGDKDIFQKLQYPDVCLHMAWKDGFIHNSDSHMLMLSKHFEFIQNMVLGGLKHLSVMGTMHEVGYFEGEINEETPCNPISLYGISKDALRRSCFELLKNKAIVFQWLRAYYIFGDDKKNHSIFTKLIEAEMEGKAEFPFTMGKNKYDFISVDELAEQIASVVLQDEVNGIINCCSGQAISLADQVESFIQKNNLNIKLKYGAFPDREYDSPAVWGNNSKIKRIMKYE
ncbi:NAD(P)-dependent oxidoreductase [Clostridiales bacterium COT073_COT-073]|nr:NAD(P)-dependent oxidoreductase [Clostridiales bacterium COT073_COT-073]